MPKLILQYQNQEWTVDLSEGTSVLGRSSRCTIPIRDQNLSREHCEIRLAGGVATLFDRGSMNGTSVNGKRVSQHRLQPGDRITLGQTVFWYESRKSAAEGSAAVASPRPPEPYDSNVVTRRALPAAVAPAPAAAVESRMAPERIPLPDYSVGGRASGGWGKIAAAVVVVGVVAWAAYSARGLLGGGGGPAEDRENLLARNPSFELEDAGRPVAWVVRSKSSATAASVPGQGRNKSAALLLEKKSAGGDLVAECEFDEDFALGKNVSLEASAYARFEGFNGWAALKIEWLRSARGAVVAEQFSPLVGRASDWTPVQGTFAPPAGAGAFRVVLAAVGRNGRVLFDDVSVRPRAGGAGEEHALGPHRLAATREGVLRLEVARRFVANIQIRLENDKEGILGQALAREALPPEKPDRLVWKGKLLNPVDFRDVDFEQHVHHAGGETAIVYSFSPGALKQIDRVTLVCTLPRVERVQGLPEKAEQTTTRVSFDTDEAEVVLEYLDPGRVRTERVRGGLRVLQSFPVDPQASEARFGVRIREAGRGTGKLDPLEEARRKRLEKRFGEALEILRVQAGKIKEAAKREPVEADIRQLQEIERREWEDVKARAFQAWYTRRPDLVTAALDAVELYQQRWPGAEYAAKAAPLREETRKLQGADAEADRPRLVLERARKFAESGRPALARALLEVLVARWPGSDAVGDAQELLKSLRQ